MPSNRQETLNLPSLRQLPLSDPDLGGQIDLFLGNMDLDDCTYEGHLKFDGLKVVNTPFGWSIAGPLLGHVPTPTLTTTVIPDNLDQDLTRPSPRLSSCRGRRSSHHGFPKLLHQT